MDIFSKKRRSEIMAAVKSRRTRPEMVFHGILKGKKVPHRMWPEIAGNPDCLVLPRTCVFVHGCFWHGCPRHFRAPKTNGAFWALKIKRNAERHLRNARRLRTEGYRVVVIWEHDLKKGRKSGLM